MQFKTTTNINSTRVGNLSGFTRLPEASIDTPTSALFTKGGSVSHLTADVLSRVFKDSRLLWVTLSSTIQLEKGLIAQGQGISKFTSLYTHIACLTLNDINEITPQGHIETDSVPLWTRNGKKKITADRYMDLMEIFKPDIIVAIADNYTSINEGYKRISKSVTRTCNMLNSCMKRYKASNQLQESAFVGALVGSTKSKLCGQYIRNMELHTEYLNGVAISGLTDGCYAMKIGLEQIEPILKCVGESIPKNLLRIVEGCWDPSVVMSAIEHGWDIFDGSYPAKLTELGRALKLNFNINELYLNELCVLDLHDKRYKDDFGSILNGCECLACVKHTRAYIHHLLNTREMLAPILLSIHNLHHFDQMFYETRQHITSNTFQSFKQHITNQYEHYRAIQDDIDKQKLSQESEVLEAQATGHRKKRFVNGDKSIL